MSNYGNIDGLEELSADVSTAIANVLQKSYQNQSHCGNIYSYVYI